MGASSEFASMLGQLDDRVDEGSVVAYGVGITTLDEVFLLVARGETNEKKDFASSGHDIGKNADATIDDEKSIASGMNLENEGLFARHVGALMKKRAANFKRDKKAWCCTTILPSLFVLIGFLLFEFAGVDRNFGALTLELDGFNVAIDSEPRNPIPFNNGSAYTCQPGFCVYGFEQFIKYVDIPTAKGPPFESQSIGPIINENSTGELYSFCGAQSYIGPNATCSIRESENVLHRITEAGAEPIGSNVLSVTNVRPC